MPPEYHPHTIVMLGAGGFAGGAEPVARPVFEPDCIADAYTVVAADDVAHLEPLALSLDRTLALSDVHTNAAAD